MKRKFFCNKYIVNICPQKQFINNDSKCDYKHNIDPKQKVKLEKLLEFENIKNDISYKLILKRLQLTNRVKLQNNMKFYDKLICQKIQEFQKQFGKINSSNLSKLESIIDVQISQNSQNTTSNSYINYEDIKNMQEKEDIEIKKQVLRSKSITNNEKKLARPFGRQESLITLTVNKIDTSQNNTNINANNGILLTEGDASGPKYQIQQQNQNLNRTKSQENVLDQERLKQRKSIYQLQEKLENETSPQKKKTEWDQIVIYEAHKQKEAKEQERQLRKENTKFIQSILEQQINDKKNYHKNHQDFDVDYVKIQAEKNKLYDEKQKLQQELKQIKQQEVIYSQRKQIEEHKQAKIQKQKTRKIENRAYYEELKALIEQDLKRQQNKKDKQKLQLDSLTEQIEIKKLERQQQKLEAENLRQINEKIQEAKYQHQSEEKSKAQNQRKEKFEKHSQMIDELATSQINSKETQRISQQNEYFKNSQQEIQFKQENKEKDEKLKKEQKKKELNNQLKQQMQEKQARFLQLKEENQNYGVMYKQQDAEFRENQKILQEKRKEKNKKHQDELKEQIKLKQSLIQSDLMNIDELLLNKERLKQITQEQENKESKSPPMEKLQVVLPRIGKAAKF